MPDLPSPSTGDATPRSVNSPPRERVGVAPDPHDPDAPSLTALLDPPPIDPIDPTPLDPDADDLLTPDETVPPTDAPPPEDNDDGDRDDRRWVTVAAFTSPTEAQIARLKLESEDIDCFLDNENLIAMDWLYSNAVGGVKLKVPEGDAPRARQLLSRPRDAAADATPSPEPLYDGQLRCPECGTTEIVHDRFDRRWAFLSILFLGLPVPVPSKGLRCTRCGATWE